MELLLLLAVVSIIDIDVIKAPDTVLAVASLIDTNALKAPELIKTPALNCPIYLTVYPHQIG